MIEQGRYALQIDEPDERKASLLMDRLDLDQAMAELRGEIVEQFVYIVPGRGQRPPKQQLSYIGVKEAARLYKNVECGAKAAQQPDGTWLITAWARNLADNFGIEEYPSVYPAFNPRDKNEQLEFRGHVSKALRNALMVVLPVTYLNKMIERWLQQQRGGALGGGVGVAAGGSPAAPRLAAPVDPEMAALREELAGWYERYPDRKAQIAAYLREKGAGRLGDEGVRTEVGKMRQRAADEQAAVDDAMAAGQDDREQRLAGAVAIARRSVERLRGRKGGLHAGDYDGLRVLLKEIRTCDPRDDDPDPAALPPRELLPALERRLALYAPAPEVEEEETAREGEADPGAPARAAGGPRTATDEDLADVPF